MMFKGSYVAVVTPFKDGKVDEERLRNLVDYQIERGTDGIVPCGTSGESATLTYEEHCQVIDICIDQTNKRVPVVAGAGSNSTHETLFLTEHAKKKQVLTVHYSSLHIITSRLRKVFISTINMSLREWISQ